MVLTEGIYTGYKYYETRYEDAVLNRYNANSSVGSTSGAWNYASEMTFPFGYGLSYTAFTQELLSVNNFGSEKITAKVKVTNTGDVAGRSVVQIYAQTSYGKYEIDHNVEKSAIQLAGIGKTKLLAPKESVEIDVGIERYLLASWDSTCNGGDGGYILSEGTYYFAVGDNAHDALNNVLAAKGATGLIDETGASVVGKKNNAKSFDAAFDESTYKFSDKTGVRVRNQFDDIDVNYWLDESQKVTYMTRSDWTTYPTQVPQIQATAEMAELLAYGYKKPENAKGYNEADFGVDAGLKLVDMKDVDWDDNVTWDKFRELSVSRSRRKDHDRYGHKRRRKALCRKRRRTQSQQRQYFPDRTDVETEFSQGLRGVLYAGRRCFHDELQGRNRAEKYVRRQGFPGGSSEKRVGL